MSVVTLDVFADYICPFCRLAEPALEQLRRDNRDIVVTRRSFELRPGTVPPFDPNAEYLQKVWESSVYPLSARVGVTMRLPRVVPRTRRTHEAAHWARSQGRFDDFHAALLAAYFERGDDIGDIDVLVSLAASLGLAAAGLRDALSSHAFEQHVIDDEELAKQMDVGSVPAFIANGRYGVIGVQPLEVLQELVDRARAG